MRTTTHRAGAQRWQGALAVLRHLHAEPGASRAAAGRALGLGSGTAAELVTRLKDLRLLDEADPPRPSGRGRPSPILVPHPRGPLVAVVDIGHERWRSAVIELGGGIVERSEGRHGDRHAEPVLADLRRRIRAVRSRHGDRLRAVSVVIAGTVRDTTVAQASNLRWRDVDLEPLRAAPGTILTAGNDASLAGLAEARRGAGRGARVVLHLTIEVGVGGVLVVDGVPVDGATGAGGEFGHMPFGDPQLVCRCGARGCWDLQVDGRAMARVLGEPAPRDPRTRAVQVLAAAGTDPAAAAAATAAATAFGRGVGGLVNALDPDLVTLSGLATGLATAVPEELTASYRAALMRFRRADPPPLVQSTLGPNGRLTGAADVAFDAVLTTDGMDTWRTGRFRRGAP